MGGILVQKRGQFSYEHHTYTQTYMHSLTHLHIHTHTNMHVRSYPHTSMQGDCRHISTNLKPRGRGQCLPVISADLENGPCLTGQGTVRRTNRKKLGPLAGIKPAPAKRETGMEVHAKARQEVRRIYDCTSHEDTVVS